MPVSRSITVPPEPVATLRAIAGLDHVRRTRTMKCTVTGGLLQLCSL